MARIKQGAASDLSAEAARVTSQLRKEAAELAIEKALAMLPKKLDSNTQDNFLKQSIKNIGDNKCHYLIQLLLHMLKLSFK